MPSAPLLPPPWRVLTTSSPEDPNDPFDPGPIGSEEEPDLFSPDPHDMWALIQREARKAGDTDTRAEGLRCYCYLALDQELQWEALSCNVL